MRHTMPPRKRHGYNWKARQHKRGDEEKHNKGRKKEEPLAVEIEATAVEYGAASCTDGSNALVLSSKRRKTDSEEFEGTTKRRKISSKQRKRLQKVVEAKEKRRKVGYSN